MPAAIKLRVIGARELPIMDSPTDSTDAYVEVCFATTTPLRTRVQKRTLNPTWNQEFRIEVADDCDLQDCPLVLKCIDLDAALTPLEVRAFCGLFGDFELRMKTADVVAAMRSWMQI